MSDIAYRIHQLFDLCDIWLEMAEEKETVETSERLSVQGGQFPGITKEVAKLLEGISTLSDGTGVNLQFDRTPVQLDNLDEFKKDGDLVLREWRLLINKPSFLGNQSPSKYHFIFFFLKNAFMGWLSDRDPLHADDVLHLKSPLVILVSGMENYFGGPKLQLGGGQKKTFPIAFDKKAAPLPSEKKIREEVHVIANDVAIAPRHVQVVTFSEDPSINRVLTLNYCLNLSACLAQEFYGKDKVILKGYRRIELPLVKNNEFPSRELIPKLEEVVQWVYEERATTRLQLITDRLSLEFKSGISFLDMLDKHLIKAFTQAKEQYKFVILNRKDAYYKEKRGLLNELRGLSKAYSEKLRNLLNGLVRDVLAAIFLVSFGLFSKTPTEVPSLMDNPYVLLLFKGLGLYFLLSFLLQSAINLSDLRQTKKELTAWMDTTRNYLSEKEMMDIIAEVNRGSNRNFIIYYILIGGIYLGIFFFCWNIEWVFDSL